MKEKRKVKIYVGNGSPMIADKVGRNDKCLCGSGLKSKKCCNHKTIYRHTEVKPKTQPETTKET